VVSVVSRDSTSPVFSVSKNCGLCCSTGAYTALAQVGGHAVAEPADHEEARSREDAERYRDGEQQAEVVANRDELAGDVPAWRRQALVDEEPHGIRERERRAGRQQQEQQRERNLPR